MDRHRADPGDHHRAEGRAAGCPERREFLDLRVRQRGRQRTPGQAGVPDQLEGKQEGVTQTFNSFRTAGYVDAVQFRQKRYVLLDGDLRQ